MWPGDARLVELFDELESLRGPDVTAERLTGAKLLRAPLPTCDDIVTTLPTWPQTIGDATAWFAADGATKTTEKKTEET